MNDTPIIGLEKRNIWMRGLLMVLMGLAYQLAGTVLMVTALVQFVFVLVSETPNVRLAAFGQSVGSFQGQVASFVSFATEVRPFPFADWPQAAP